MWIGYEDALLEYFWAIEDEYVTRGYKPHKWKHGSPPKPKRHKDPHWIGRQSLHRSHKSNLLRKNTEYYGEFCWNVPNNLPYVWPV